MEFIISVIVELWGLTVEMAPYLLFGFLFAGILHIFLKKEKVGRMLNGNNLKSVANATFLGIPLPLCSCGVIPAGLSFFKNGASKGSTVSFLISTPQTGIDSILVTYSLLGLPFAIIRPFVALVTGITGGILANKIKQPSVVDRSETSINNERKSIASQAYEVLRYGFVDLIQDVSKWLVIGLLFAALLAVVIPEGFFIQYVNYPWLNMLLVLAASVPLYICATGSVPIAAVLMMKGLSPGAALVFLMAGPATNIATITVLWKTIGKAATLIYLATIIIGALVFGYLIDAFLPIAWFEITNHNHSHHHLLPHWVGVISAFLLIGLVVNGYILSYFDRKRQKRNEYKIKAMMLVHKYKVEGMTCKNCKAHVEKDIASIEGVEAVIADFTTGEVSITGKNFNNEHVKEAVESGGYKFIGKL